MKPRNEQRCAHCQKLRPEDQILDDGYCRACYVLAELRAFLRETETKIAKCNGEVNPTFLTKLEFSLNSLVYWQDQN